MSWATPTLRRVRELVRDEITASLSGAVLVGNNVLRVMADAMAALCHLTLRFIEWVALQLMPDTAETEWLDRHGDIWLTNADGSTGRKGPAFASGTVNLTGDAGTVVPLGTVLVSGDVSYETTEEIKLGTGNTVCPILALDPGTAGNLQTGDTLAVTTTVLGLDGTAVAVEVAGGTDEEIDSDLRTRVLQRIRQPPMGGAAHDYVRWALEVPGVTRAWCAPLEMGIGTVTVRFMMDELRAENQGFPTPYDCRQVEEFLDTVRPVAVKDRFVVAPIPQRVDFTLTNLFPDNTATRAAIQDSILDMLDYRAAPGQTIFAAWKSEAILSAAGVISFTLISDNDVMESPGHMAALGDIFYVGV